jgi:hypothetical protein
VDWVNEGDWVKKTSNNPAEIPERVVNKFEDNLVIGFRIRSLYLAKVLKIDAKVLKNRFLINFIL